MARCSKVVVFEVVRGKRLEERSQSKRSLPDWSSDEWESQDE